MLVNVFTCQNRGKGQKSSCVDWAVFELTLKNGLKCLHDTCIKHNQVKNVHVNMLCAYVDNSLGLGT